MSDDEWHHVLTYFAGCHQSRCACIELCPLEVDFLCQFDLSIVVEELVYSNLSRQVMPAVI